MTQLTPEQQTVAEQLYYRVLVTQNNRYGYYSLRADKIEDFKQLITQENFTVPDYAVLLESGEGTPSAAEKKAIEERYGISHNFQKSFLKLASAA